MDQIVKVYASFLRNTIDPIIDKVMELKDYAESKGIAINKETLSELINKAFVSHLVIFLLDWFFKLIVTAAVCFTVFKVL